MSSLEDYEMPPMKRRRDHHQSNDHEENRGHSPTPVLHWYSSNETTGVLVNRHILLLLTLSLTSIALGITSLCLWASFSTSISEMQAIMDTIRINLTRQGEEHNYQLDNRLLFSSSKILETVNAIESRMTGELKDKEESLWSLHQDDINELKENITAVQNLVEKTGLHLELLDKRGNATFQILDETINRLESKVLNAMQTVRNESVPIGFIYVQYGHQVEPRVLWPLPKFDWIEITSNYAGQFFRAFGPNSAPFNSTQDEDAPRLSNVRYTTGSGNGDVSLVVGGATNMVRSGYPSSAGNNWGGLIFTMSAGQVRPYNSAIRIWKRVA